MINKNSTSSYDIVGVGRACFDYAVLVESYPGCDTKTEAIDHFDGGGSPVPNALCQLSVWGHKTLLNSVIGSDVEGIRFMDETSAYKVDTKYVSILNGERTPRAYLWIEKNSGNRTIVLDRDIAPLSPQDVPFEELKNCRVLLIDGWEADAAIEAANIVRRAGGKVMLDAGNIRPRMEELIRVTDWLIVPQAFANAYYGNINQVDIIKDLRKQGTEIAAVTNGTEGCIIAWENHIARFPAYKVDVTDTTGAGDIYHAGMLHGIIKDWSIPNTVRWASAASAITVQSLGGRGKLPTKSEVKSFIESNSWMESKKE